MFELKVSEDTEISEVQTTLIEWKIKNYSDQLRKYIKFFDSPPFYYSHTNWSIRLSTHIVMILKAESPTEHDIYFIFGVRKHDGSYLKCVESRMQFKLEKGFSKPLRLTGMPYQLKDFVNTDGTLTVFLSLRSIEDGSSIAEFSSQTLFPVTSTVESASQSTSFDGILTLSADLKNMYISKSHADITILVKNKKFSAHRNILAARSAVFASMFEHAFAEKNSGTVEIPDCDPDSFELFLVFLYTGNMDGIECSKAVNLYKTADKYDVKELKEECARCLIRDVSVDSFCDIIHLAAMHNDSDLVKAATDFFIANTEVILLTTKWQDLLKEHPLLCNELYLKGIKSKK